MTDEITTDSPSQTDQQREQMHLPTSIVSTSDVRRIHRQLDSLEDTIRAVRLRTNSPVSKLPRTSRALEEFASTNRLNLLLPDDRHHAAVFIDYIMKKAPVLRISFASEPTRRFTTELMVWLRQHFDPEMLVEIGREPAIAAGCVVRTSSKVFDFSLLEHMTAQRQLLADKLFDVRSAAVALAPSEEPHD